MTPWTTKFHPQDRRELALVVALLVAFGAVAAWAAAPLLIGLLLALLQIGGF